MLVPLFTLSKAVAFPPFVFDWCYQKIFAQQRDDCEIFSPRPSPVATHTVVLQSSFVRECACDNDTKHYVQRCTSSIFFQISTYVLYRFIIYIYIYIIYKHLGTRHLAQFLMSSFSISSGHHTLYGTKDNLVDQDFNWHCYNNFNNHQKKGNNMSQCDVTEAGVPLNSPAFLSWRKLQLSRAKLKASSKTSALLSGFAMVAMVEMQISEDSTVPEGMLIAFAICTTLLVAVHMLALMISTCILPNIDAVCNLHSVSLVHEAPHERLHWYIETAWAFSTLLGLLLFLAEIAILCWVKFYDISKYAAWSAVIMLIPVLVIFLAFAIHFYQSMVAHKYEVTVSGIRQLELLKEQIEAGDLERTNGLLLNTSGTQIV